MKDNTKLLNVLNTMLKISEDKLKYAIDKNKEWDIEHYTNSINIIKEEIK